MTGSTIARRTSRALNEAAGKMAIKKHMMDVMNHPGNSNQKLAVMRVKDKEAGRLPANYDNPDDEKDEKRKKEEDKPQ